MPTSNAEPLGIAGGHWSVFGREKTGDNAILGLHQMILIPSSDPFVVGNMVHICTRLNEISTHLGLLVGILGDAVSDFMVVIGG